MRRRRFSRKSLEHGRERKCAAIMPHMATADASLQHQSAVARGASAAVVYTMVLAGGAMVQATLVLQYLDADLAGLWFLMLAVGGWVVFLDLGVGPTLAREIALSIGRETDAGARAQEVGALVASARALSVAVSVALLLIAMSAGSLIILGAAPRTELQSVVVAWGIFSVGVGISPLANARLAALTGLGKVATERSVRIVAVGITVVPLSVLALHLGLGLPGLAAAWSAQWAIAWVIGSFRLQRLRDQVPSSQPDRRHIRQSIMPSLKWWLTGVGGMLIYQADAVIIAIALGTASVTGYVAVSMAFRALASLSGTVVLASLPFLSRSHGAGDRRALGRRVLTNSQISAGLMLTFAIPFAVVGPEIVSIWLGAAHSPGGAVIALLALSWALEAHQTPHSQAVMATGHMAFWALALMAAGFKIALATVLIGPFGLEGVALATFAAQLGTSYWYPLMISARTFGWGVRHYAGRILGPVLVIGVMECLAALGAKAVLSDRGDITTTVGVGTVTLMVAVFGGLIIFTSNGGNRIERVE